MDNVPSSAILAIIAIVAACLLGAFIFTTVQSQKEAGNKAVGKVESMNASLDEAQLTQYDQTRVTGSQVLAAIKNLSEDEVSVKVINTASDSVNYNYACDGTALGARVSDADRAAALGVAKDNSQKNYITPSANYDGAITRDANTGAIIMVTFTRIDRTTGQPVA